MDLRNASVETASLTAAKSPSMMILATTARPISRAMCVAGIDSSAGLWDGAGFTRSESIITSVPGHGCVRTWRRLLET